MNFFLVFLKGLAMGAANVIPGVSGGTVAFITGIYERLINALKNIDLTTIKLFLTGRFSEFSQRIDLQFLFILFLGVFISILSLAKVLIIAFENYETLTLSFFFGLIVASILAVSRQIDGFSISVALMFLIGASIAILIAFLPPAQPNDSFTYLVLCGIAAVCSMILPGISGSYILLLMGNYVLVLEAISNIDLNVMIPILIGCIIGMITLSRLLSYLFKQHKNLTVSLLAGFVAGSLLIIWPWKTTLTEMLGDKEKAVGYIWEIPKLDSSFFFSIGIMVIGFLVVHWMDRVTQKSAKAE